MAKKTTKKSSRKTSTKKPLFRYALVDSKTGRLGRFTSIYPTKSSAQADIYIDPYLEGGNTPTEKVQKFQLIPC